MDGCWVHRHWVCIIPRFNVIHSSVTSANAVPPSPQLKYCLKVRGDMIDILTDHKKGITTGVKSCRLGNLQPLGATSWTGGPTHPSTCTEQKELQ